MNPLRTHPALSVALLSGALGFYTGIVNFPEWQAAVETAQVTAGLVSYPPGNPTFIYHVKLWSLLHHVLAVALWLGVGEITLSYVVSGVLGMVSFQALAMLVFAIGREPLLAVASAYVIFFAGATDFGVTYPVMLLGVTHTYGSIALSLVVLVAALYGAGRDQPATFLLGLAPSVHPSLGAWLWLLIGACVLWDAGWFRRNWRRLAPYFAGGFAITGVSLAVQFASMPTLPAADTAEARQYILAFLSFWDGHRQPVTLHRAGLLINGAALGLAAVWLTLFSADVTRERRFLFRFVLVSAVLGLAAVLVSWIPVVHLPLPLLILMPTRLLNICAMITAPLLMGLLVQYRHTVWGAVGLPVAAASLMVANRSLLWSEVADEHHSVLHDLPRRLRGDTLELLLLTTALIVTSVLMSRLTTFVALKPRQGRLITRASWAATTGVAVWAASLVWPVERPTHHIFLDRTNAPVFTIASQQPGLLLTGGNFHLAQMRTRRPVLLAGGGLDGLAYAAESAVDMARIMNDVYGIDLLNPPEEARHSGTMPNNANRVVWERYTRERWRAIGREYGVTQVMTYPDWTLDLPVAARDGDCVLYDIPES